MTFANGGTVEKKVDREVCFVVAKHEFIFKVEREFV
jgi:hypothetical protein